VEELLQSAVEALLVEHEGRGQGDDFRVLYGRLCEGLTAQEVADALGLALSQSENAYKRARRRLAEILRELMRRHVEGYCGGGEPEDEFRAEWARLEEHLSRRGELEQAVRGAYQGLDPGYGPERKAVSVDSAITRVREQMRVG
jgi:hypothetical protein